MNTTPPARGVRSRPSGMVSRTLLLAGGTDGIGLAFLEAECQRDKYSLIYVLGRDFRQVDGLRVGGGRVVNVVCDITDAITMRQSLADAAIRRVDDFINTIGTFARGPVSQLTDEEVLSHFELNCVGNINLIRAVLPLMLAQQGGGDDAAETADGRAASAPELSGGGTGAQILVCTASLALEARSPYALQSATKAALKFFVDALRIELRGRVRVMSVLPPSSRWNTPSCWYRSIPWPPGAGPAAPLGCAIYALRTSQAPLRAPWATAVRVPNLRLSSHRIRGAQHPGPAWTRASSQRPATRATRQGTRRPRGLPTRCGGCSTAHPTCACTSCCWSSTATSADVYRTRLRR
jgi:NAD(P)-dependent dehydrogenase (short-subunit alcohol dehydrogenase family)